MIMGKAPFLNYFRDYAIKFTFSSNSFEISTD